MGVNYPLKTNKGQMLGGKLIYFIVAILVISVVLLAFVNITSENQKIKVNCIDPIYHEIMIAKVLTDSNCLTYFDEDTDRAIVGTIDLSKFNDDNLNSCFTYLDPDNLEFKVMQRFIDTSIGLTLYGQTIGTKEFEEKQTINKIIQVYDKGELKSSNLEFNFELIEC